SRFTATLVDPAQQRLLKKYGLALADLFHGPERTRERLASRALPAELDSHFTQVCGAVSEQLASLQSQLEQLDHTLVDAARHAGSKMLYQLERLRGRAARAELRRNSEIARHADRLSSSLFPNRDLQERVYPGALYLARYGRELLDGLLQQVHIECQDHQVVFL
ncbi:MAG TPA: bacillithiol biosynthesis BshC, partial [Terriglobales bacterium]|nr:bacillithiol biosynthesis BshC [Terriglobales bacterium]